MARRLALIIGNTTFDDKEHFQELHTTANNARDIADVLKKYGKFEIIKKPLINAKYDEIKRAIVNLYKEAKKGDLTLLYFAGHGFPDKKDPTKLFLIAKNTFVDDLLLTGIEDSFISQAKKSHSRAKHHIIILDCCYSGAILKGQSQGALGTVRENISLTSVEALKGEAMVVLASSDAYAQSFEYAEDEKSGRNSLFTRYLLEGIITSEADKDGDGRISIDELFTYAEEKVREVRPEQNPIKQTRVQEHEISIAWNPKNLELHQKYERVKQLVAQENWPEALSCAKEIYAIKPDFLNIQTILKAVEALTNTELARQSKVAPDVPLSEASKSKLLSLFKQGVKKKQAIKSPEIEPVFELKSKDLEKSASEVGLLMWKRGIKQCLIKEQIVALIQKEKGIAGESKFYRLPSIR